MRMRYLGLVLVIVTTATMALTSTPKANAAVLGASTGIFPNYLQLLTFTYNTSSADWLTVSSMGVAAAVSRPIGGSVYEPWFDAPLPPGEIVYVWISYTAYPPVTPGPWMITGSHRYVEAGGNYILPNTFFAIVAP
jgi:hypothetical protein